MKTASNFNYTIKIRQSRYYNRERHFDSLESAIKCARTEYSLTGLNSEFLASYDSDWFYQRAAVA
ncbi:MAG: hypothetical protein LBI13_06000 [Streptococcaceae bacterium]|jgi:hypothetical protein|nr:hypothetical protein [Streptococcaceae bacterium]